MNCLILTGKVVEGVTSSNLPTGTKMTEFSIEVKEGISNTFSVKLKCFGKVADFSEQCCKIGTLVECQGRIKKQGTYDKYDFIVSEIKTAMGENNPSAMNYHSNSQPKKAPKQEAPAPQETTFTPPNDEDLPF